MTRFKRNDEILIAVSDSVVGKMRTCAREADPYEGCALLFGEKGTHEIEGGTMRVEYLVERVDCIPSSKLSQVSFIIEDTETFYKYWSQAAREGMKLVGIFHSHPAPAYPSGVDVDNMILMHEGNFKHSIWIILGSRGKLNAFIYFQGKIQQVNLHIGAL